MNNIIFLDIDGVLNSQKLFIQEKMRRINYYKHLPYDKTEIKLLIKLLDIDFEKVLKIKELTHLTNSKIVVCSGWKNLRIWPLVEEYLINLGLPILDTTLDLSSNRGKEIRTYLKNQQVDNYIIIDDDIFPDFDQEQLSHLIHTNFYTEGIDEDNFYDAFIKLKSK